MIELPSTEQIQTEICEIEENYSKVKILPVYALDYKLKLYSFLRSMHVWAKECSDLENSLLRKYAKWPQADLGNTIAVLNDYAEKFRKASACIQKTMNLLQPSGTNVKAVMDDIDEKGEQLKDELEHIDRLIKAFGPMEDSIKTDELINLNK